MGFMSRTCLITDATNGVLVTEVNYFIFFLKPFFLFPVDFCCYRD